MGSNRYRAVTGASLVGVGAVTILGFVTAEALFPGYSTGSQAISALGAVGGTPASRAVFNGAMVVSGGLALVAAYGLHRVYGRGSLTGVVVLTGVGLAGVGVFPTETGAVHVVAATVAFVGAGLSALVVAVTVRGAFGYLSAVLGVLELAALVLFAVVGGGTQLGFGGLERWVAYLGLVWVVAFGGHLLPGDVSGG